MGRIAIEFSARRMEAAYRSDPFHAFRKNLESVRPEEWAVRPADWSVQEFGDAPELSICDIALHVGGAKFMYADRLFGDASLEWGAIVMPPTLSMEDVMGWLDDGHRLLAEGLDALRADEDLVTERPAPWRLPMRREQLLSIVVNHDLYHSGEINRQRALLRGATGWDRMQ